MPNIKFSDFTAEAEINNFEGVVGYNTTGNLNLRIAPLEMPARYDGNIALGDSSTLQGTNLGLAGEQNLAIGFNALASVDIAGAGVSGCIAIGDNSLTLLTTFGAQGTGEQLAIGISAQAENGGYIAGSNITPADENLAIGYNALASNKGDWSAAIPTPYPDDLGNFNTAVGGRSLEDLDGGTSNTALGHNSGFTLFDGSANTFVGFESGSNAASIPGGMLSQDGAVAIGWQAASEGSYGVTIGYNSTSTLSPTPGALAPDETIVIGGSSTTATTCNVNNSIVIGSRSTYTASNAPTSGDNVLIGFGSTVTDGQVYINGRNTIIGSQCTVEGSYQTHIGWAGSVTGEDNNSIGYLNSVHGENNVSLGDSSTLGVAGPGGGVSNCVALGGDITIPSATNGSICIGAGTQATLNNAFEIGFGGSFGVPATNDIIFVGANGGTVASSKIDVINDLIITTGTGTLQVGDFQGQGNSQFSGPVNINNTITAAVSGPVSPDFSGGNIITWTLTGDISLNAPTIPVIAGGTTAGTYIMIINTGGFTITSFNAVYKWSGGIGSFPGLGANTAILTWISDGTNFYGTIAQNFS